jgi:hypothetical protein
MRDGLCKDLTLATISSGLDYPKVSSKMAGDVCPANSMKIKSFANFKIRRAGL